MDPKWILMDKKLTKKLYDKSNMDQIVTKELTQNELFWISLTFVYSLCACEKCFWPICPTLCCSLTQFPPCGEKCPGIHWQCPFEFPIGCPNIWAVHSIAHEYLKQKRKNFHHVKQTTIFNYEGHCRYQKVEWDF